MHVILLLGSSTAGKSSLCKELVKTNNLVSNSVDEVARKCMFEYAEKIKPLLDDELTKINLYKKLDSYMTVDEVKQLAATGIVSLSKGHCIMKEQFQNSTLVGLEDLLKTAGMSEEEISLLAENLRAVTSVYDLAAQQVPWPDPMTKLYDEVFIEDNSDKTIILDVIPNESESVEEFIKQFNTRVKQYKSENPALSLTTSTVLAYCPMQALSNRIQSRNNAATQEDRMNQRIGLFPFFQLASLVKAEHVFNPSFSDTLTKTEIFYILNKHIQNTGNDGLLLENPVDLDGLNYPSANPVKIVVNNEGSIHIAEDELNTLEFEKDISEIPRIGTEKVIKEYTKLVNKFGFLSTQEKTSLNLNHGVVYDIIINTANGTPAELANELMDKLRNIGAYEQEMNEPKRQ
ncbi:hypothetical protein [Legionella gresilensis]|uniref:hypothetical protein n=1 Tax=Legionella gresilensis TaxID=91823 RepID=UPI0010418AD5|nr:hypothetical protein [Legionella gresilensis]